MNTAEESTHCFLFLEGTSGSTEVVETSHDGERGS